MIHLTVSDPLSGIAVAAAAFPLSWLGVAAVHMYATRAGVLDQPNSRSSHRVPTPRGGGLGLVAAVLTAGSMASLGRGLAPGAVLLAVVAVTSVALVGWLDDHRPVRTLVRLVVHVIAGVTVAVLAAPLQWRAFGGVADAGTAIGWLSGAVVVWWWVFWTVSAVNVINFMDGIDGLIGAQIVVYGTYVAVLSAPGSLAFVLGATLAAASCAFLWWNWSPAKIFLGDVGSGSCGVLVVLTGLALLIRGGVSLPRTYLPLYPLFLDAAVTLVRRRRAGERLTTPHRSHLYQRLANGPWSHARTSVAFAIAAAAGLAVGVLAGHLSAPASATLIGLYMLIVPLAGRRLERIAPWRAPV